MAAATVVVRPVLAQNRSEDEYTRYELLAPETSSFKIVYDVTAVSPGARFFFNPIRLGSVATDESVIDLMTGAPAEVSGSERRRSARVGAGEREPRGPVHPRRAGEAGAAGRRRTDPHHQDLQGSEELLPRRQRDRVRSAARHQAQRRRPAAGLRARVVQHSLAGDRGVRRPRRHQLHEHLSGPGAAGAARQSARETRRRRRRAPLPRRRARARRPIRVRRCRRWSACACRSAPSRIARSCTSSRAPRRTRSACTTTTRKPGKAPTSTSTSSAAGSTVSDPSAKILDTGEALKTETLKGQAITAARDRHRRSRATRVGGRGDQVPAGQERAEHAAPDRGDLHRSRALRSRSTDS